MFTTRFPRFAPECFAYLRNPQTAKYKQFRQGLDQLLQEGVIQVFNLRDAVTKVPLLAAVGPLQFEVVQLPAPERIRRGIPSGNRRLGPRALAGRPDSIPPPCPN